MLDGPTTEGVSNSPRKFNIALLSILLWALLAGYLAYRQWVAPQAYHADAGAKSPAVTAPSHSTPTAAPSAARKGLSALIDERLVDLNATPKSVVMPTDLAFDAAVAIKSGEYPKAAQIANDVLAKSALRDWGFYPFNDFLSGTVGGADQVLLDHLDAWIKLDPHSAIAHLIRARYYRQAALQARHGDGAIDVPEPLLEAAKHDVTLAIADLKDSIKIDPHLPLSRHEMLAAAIDSGDAQQVEEVFQAGVAAFPKYYNLYKLRLGAFGRSPNAVEMMYAFVDKYAGAAPTKSPLKMLYIDLYVDLLTNAARNCGYPRDACLKRASEGFIRPSLTDGMLKALNLYKVSDHAQFSMAIWPLLKTMSCDKCFGSPAVVGGILQMAANVMGSDNRMMDEPTHNSYVLDDITARVWVQMDSPGNAEDKFREALRDIQQTHFSDEVEKAEALAHVYEDMLDVANDKEQFIDMIVYRDAADAVAGVHHLSEKPWIKCYALYRMRRLEEAEHECTALIESNGDYMETRYYRGKVYEASRQWDASIADLNPIADSAHHYFRVGAALDASYDYGQKGDFAGQLTFMNAHPYLFDADIMQDNSDIAVSYNNRCFAEMKLNMLQKALDDCTISLQYDRIPDALSKQQELLKLLAKTST